MTAQLIPTPLKIWQQQKQRRRGDLLRLRGLSQLSKVGLDGGRLGCPRSPRSTDR